MNPQGAEGVSQWPHGRDGMAALIRTYDWETTPLGPIDRWPQSLKTIVELMLASPGMMSLVWGAEAIHLYNDAFTELLREQPVPPLGRSAFETFARSRDVFAADIAAGMAGASARLPSQRYPVLRNGRREDAWFDVDYAPVRDDTGRIAGVLWTLREATAQVVAERAVHESDARHRLLIEDWAQAVWETDANGVVVADSPSWRAYTGQTVAQWLGSGWLDAIHPDDRAFAERRWQEAIAICSVVEAEFRLRSADGGWRWTNVRAAPIRDRAGTVAKWVGINVDIDARKRAEAALRDSEERQAFLLRLSDAIRPLVAAADVQATATRLLGEHLRADRAMYAEVTGEPGAEAGTIRGQFIRPPAPDRPAPAPFPDHFTYETFGADVMARRYSGEGLAVADVNADADFDPDDRAAWAVVGVRAAIVAPLVKGGRLVAELGVHSETPRTWTDAEIRLVHEVGERTWAAAERVRAEAALRESEERYRLLFESMDEAYAVVEVLKDATGAWADFRFVEVNPAFLAHTSMPWPVGRTATELLGSPNPRWTQLYGQALDSGQAIRVEEAEPTLDRIFDLNIFALDRRRHRVAVLFTNITKRKRAEVALRDSEQWLQTLMMGVPQLVWRAVDGGHWTWASPQWTAFTGQAQADSHDWGWLDPVHPDDREAVKERWASAATRGEFQADYRICHVGEQRHRWFQSRATPVRDDAGAIVEWLGTSTDVDDLRALQERQSVLVTELQHRTFNLMGVVRSMADATIKSSPDLAAFKAHFDDRIAALARVQRLLSRLADDDRVSFGDLIHGELDAIGALPADDPRVTLAGPPDVLLRSSTVQTFAMAVHELTTNAVKYGALSQADAHLSIAWHVATGADGAPWLHLDWHESGVAMPPRNIAPRGTGQGRRLIEGALPYQLHARTTYVMGEDGVRCSITLRVSTWTAHE